MKNYYQILQVDPAAEAEVISAAYKRLCLKYHPDVNSDAAALQRMQAINEAYEVLGNAQSRAAYDAHSQRASRAGQRTATQNRSISPAQAFGEAWNNYHPNIPLSTDFVVNGTHTYHLDFAHVETGIGITFSGKHWQTEPDIQKAGWQICYFSAAEITQNPERCVDEVYMRISQNLYSSSQDREADVSSPPPTNNTTPQAPPSPKVAAPWWPSMLWFVSTIASGALAALAGVFAFALIGGTLQVGLAAVCLIPLVGIAVFWGGRFVSTLHLQRPSQYFIPILWVVVCVLVYIGYTLFLTRFSSEPEQNISIIRDVGIVGCIIGALLATRKRRR
jgi:hypothetical protein